jgi:hypothetical protein
VRAINHALTGAIIGLTVTEPLIAVPLAVASHYVCDAIPHYGANLPNDQELRSKLFRNLLYIDTVLCFVLVIVLAVWQPAYWLLAAICAFAAAAPDWLSFNRYWAVRRHRVWHNNNVYYRFAKGIQWFERPIGAVVEVAWFTGCIALLLPFFALPVAKSCQTCYTNTLCRSAKNNLNRLS